MRPIDGYRAWLATVEGLSEAELPHNSTTVAYAIRAACALRDEADELRASLDALLAGPAVQP